MGDYRALFVRTDDGYGWRAATDEEIEANGWKRADAPAVEMGRTLSRAFANRGAVEERDKLRRLVLRDHAQGHKAHADCPACWKFGVRPNGWKGGR